MSFDIRNHKVQKIGGGLLIFLIIGVLWFTQVYSPNKEIIDEKRQALEQLNLKLSNIKLSAAKLPQLKKEVEKLFIRYKLLEELMPSDRNVADFVNKLNISARENNVKVKKIDVNPSEMSNYFYTNPYKVQLVGKYHELGSILEAIANLKFIATAKNVSLKKSSSGRATVIADFTISSYHIPTTERLEPPTIITDNLGTSGGKGISKPSSKPRPRATESDALSGVSGGIVPSME